MKKNTLAVCICVKNWFLTMLKHLLSIDHLQLRHRYFLPLIDWNIKFIKNSCLKLRHVIPGSFKKACQFYKTNPVIILLPVLTLLVLVSEGYIVQMGGIPFTIFS